MKERQQEGETQYDPRAGPLYTRAIFPGHFCKTNECAYGLPDCVKNALITFSWFEKKPDNATHLLTTISSLVL